MLIIFLLTLLLQFVSTWGLSLRLCQTRSRWSKVHINFIAALPLPFLLLAFSAFVFLRTVNESQAECGPDACGWAIIAAMFGAIAAALLYLAGIDRKSVV